MIPLTGNGDYSLLHDEPSRQLRVFPSRGTASAGFTLYEDDGISDRYRDGDYAEAAFDLQTSSTSIMLAASARGRYRQPNREIAAKIPASQTRKISLGSGDVARVFAP